MSKVRILQFGMTDNPGGVESFIMNYYRNLNKNDIQFDFISMYDEVAYEKEIEQLGGNIHKVSHFRKNVFKYVYELIKIVQYNNYQIVHVNMLSKANIIPLLICKILKVKCIIAHSHNASIPPGRLRKIMDRINSLFISKLFTHALACSEKAAKWMFGEEEEVKIIHNAIDLNLYSYDVGKRCSKRKELGVDEKFVLGHIGRFSYQKNHDFLLDLFYAYYQINNNAVLLLIGDGEEKKRILQRATELGIIDSIMFLGIREDIDELLQAIDLFLLPSHFEGLPLVLIEAQAAGLPCIVSDKVSTESEITNIIKFLSIDNALDKWINQVEIFRELKERKKLDESIKSNGYSILTEAKKLEDFYLELYKMYK